MYGVLLAAESTAVMLPFISGALRNNHNMYEAAGNNMLVMRNGVIGLGGAHVAAYHGMLCCLVGWDVVTYTTAEVLAISAGFHPADVSAWATSRPWRPLAAVGSNAQHMLARSPCEATRTRNLERGSHTN